MNNNLTLANQARLDKVLNRLHMTVHGVMTLREYLDTYATGFGSILGPSVQYNRIKYNRMNNEQQDEYQKKLDKKVTKYYAQLDGDFVKPIPKIVYDYYTNKLNQSVNANIAHTA